MSKQDCIKVEGTVVEDLSNSRFMVELDNGVNVNCTIAGKLRLKNIRIMVMDRVTVELSVYDPAGQGRISYRLTGNENKKVLDKDKKKNNNNKKTTFKKK